MTQNTIKTLPRDPAEVGHKSQGSGGCFTAIISDYNMREISKKFRSKVSISYSQYITMGIYLYVKLQESIIGKDGVRWGNIEES